jgi:hypothetical protein
MYRKSGSRPLLEEELPSDEEQIQLSLDGSHRPSSKKHSRFGDREEGNMAARLSRSRLTEPEVSPTYGSPGGQQSSPHLVEEQEEFEGEYEDNSHNNPNPEHEQHELSESGHEDPEDEGYAPDTPTAKYFGFTKSGLKHGMGILIGNNFEYEGQFKDGQYHGLGRLRTLNFEYEGAFEQSLPKGAGILIKETGVFKGKFDGNFEPEGMGEIQIPGGAVYRGMISASRLQGFGTLTDSKGKTYTGNWKDGLKDGLGREKSKAGEYVGSWSKGMRHGAGSYTTQEWRYEGDWKHGKREGIGLYKEGQITYLGSFEADLRNGLGKLIDGHSKTSYYGGFLNDMKQGIGFLILANDESYFGEWNEDKKHGVGVLVRGNIEIKAIWVDDDMHGYAYVTQPGKSAKIEVYSRGRLVGNPARKPTQVDIKELLARVSETLPGSFFKIVSEKLNSLVVKEPLIHKSNLVRDSEKALKEVDAAVQNSRVACEKDRKDFKSWLLKRNVNTNMDNPKSWDLEAIQQKRSKRESEAEVRSTFDSQFGGDEEDQQNKTEIHSKLQTSRIQKKLATSHPKAIKNLEEDGDEPSSVIIRTARRNGRQENQTELDEMVRRKGRPQEARKQATIKRDQAARIAEVEADFQKYLHEKEACHIPEIPSGDEAEENKPEDPQMSVEIGKKYQPSYQNFDEPDFNTNEFSAYREPAPNMSSRDKSKDFIVHDKQEDSFSKQGAKMRKTSIDIAGSDPHQTDDKPDAGYSVYKQTDVRSGEKSGDFLDIQGSRADLSISGKSRRKPYSLPKEDFDIDNNDAAVGKVDQTSPPKNSVADTQHLQAQDASDPKRDIKIEETVETKLREPKKDEFTLEPSKIPESSDLKIREDQPQSDDNIEGKRSSEINKNQQPQDELSFQSKSVQEKEQNDASKEGPAKETQAQIPNPIPPPPPIILQKANSADLKSEDPPVKLAPPVIIENEPRSPPISDPTAMSLPSAITTSVIPPPPVESSAGSEPASPLQPETASPRAPASASVAGPRAPESTDPSQAPEEQAQGRAAASPEPISSAGANPPPKQSLEAGQATTASEPTATPPGPPVSAGGREGDAPEEPVPVQQAAIVAAVQESRLEETWTVTNKPTESADRKPAAEINDGNKAVAQDGVKIMQDEGAGSQRKDLADKTENKDLTDKPESKDLTDKPESKDLTDKPERKDLTDKPERKDLTDKPENKDVANKSDVQREGGVTGKKTDAIKEPEAKKAEPKQEAQKPPEDWRSKIPDPLANLQQQGMSALLNKGKGFLGF